MVTVQFSYIADTTFSKKACTENNLALIRTFRIVQRTQSFYESPWHDPNVWPVPCSALAVLSSSSGVSNERQAFMKLVSNEIDRLNSSFAKRGNVSMVFQSGGVTVSS